MSGPESMAPLPSRIASLVHAHFDALPARSKPNIFPDGSREWIPMTGIVAVNGENTPSESIHCIAITTGAKCLSASQMPQCRGMVLHDCHAEILAIRAFNYWLLTECHSLLAAEQSDSSISSQSSLFINRRKTEKEPSVEWPPFEIQPDVNLYMYCTCAPCGDGSMELCMASQEDATPWKMDDEPKQTLEMQEGAPLVDGPLLHGRAHFSLLGVVRRKPARTDAESTCSKSCSDKLALKQVSSLLSWQTTHLVAPTENAYIRGLILPEDEISRVACERAFGENGRMKNLKGRSWNGNTDDGIEYRFRPFEVISVPAEEIKALWTFAKPKSITPAPSSLEKPTLGEGADPPKKSKPGNVSAVWTAAPSIPHTCSMLSDAGSKKMPSLRKSKTGLYETIIGGVKQGHKASSPSTKGASALSRARLWGLMHNTIQLEGCIQEGHNPEKEPSNTASDKPTATEQTRAEPSLTYQQQKENPGGSLSPCQVRRKAIQDARESLKGWAPNVGDEGWSLDVLMEPRKRKR